ncbi:MAG: hypothetical protein KDA24_22015 [Deltaproteobacteria bacterium]|nr:hypothetical protein [Deltaproteobacteria bacterium]
MSRKLNGRGACGTHVGALLGALVLATGCPTGDGVEPPTPTDDRQAEHPCHDVWGPVPDAGRLYVEEAAREDGDGSLDNPFDTVDAALVRARADGARSIAIAGGNYEGTYLLSNDVADWADSGLEITGCGRQNTMISGVIREVGIGGGSTEMRLQPVFDITGDTTADLLVRDLGALGGRRTLVVRDGAGAFGPVVFQRVDVLQAVRLGVLIDGATTVAHLLDVVIEEVAAEFGAFGWGVSIQTGQQLATEFANPVVLEGLEVRDVRGLGVLADGAFLDLRGALITGVQSNADGRLGRGLQLQRWSQASLDDLEATQNSDAAVFLESPGRAQYVTDENGNPVMDEDDNPVVERVEPVQLLNSILGDTSAATLPGGGQTGDGLVATQFTGGGAGQPPEAFQVVIDGTEIAGNPRSQVLAEAVTASLGSNSIFSKGTAYPVVAQNGAIIEGLNGGAPPDNSVELGGGDALGIDSLPVELDDPTED